MQYIDGKPYGKGYRVIAYRNDNYVDVYDDYSLTYLEDEKFDIAEKGLNKHIQTHLCNVVFEKTDGDVEISFAFSDLLSREISVSIAEHSRKKSISMNLLAPIGAGSRKPNFMPVFFMYDFDFVRRSKTAASITIDRKAIDMDKFPMPMNMQFRYYSRYSTECQLINFINTDCTKLTEVELDNELSFTEDGVRYCFDSNRGLKVVNIETGSTPINVEFEPALTFNEDSEGTFSIVPDECMGYIKGEYKISEDNVTNTYKLILIPSGGWTSVPNSMIAKMILSHKSVFCCWSKKYRLQEIISLKDMTVDAEWSNGNL